MGFHSSRRVAYIAGACIALALSACQGNLGSGSGLSIPQAPGYGQPGGPGQGGAASQSRQQVLEGAVYLTPSTSDVPLPQVDGFGVTVALGTAPPSAPPDSIPSVAPVSGPVASAAKRRSTHLPGASPAPAGSPSSAPSPAPTVSASAPPSAKPSAGAHPSPSPSPAKIETKTIAYPDDAPAAPTPEPTGNVQTFVKRTPLVRGYVMPSKDVTLYGLAAIRFTIPSTEETPQRGFTVAVFQSGKKHREKLMDSDTAPTLANDVIASNRTDAPIVLKKDTGYLLMLYGDEAPSTPAPVQAGYPTPGNNPFPAPSGYATQQPGMPVQPPYPGNPTYQPGGPTNPYATPTPFR
jgi:hypothetical protein